MAYFLVFGKDGLVFPIVLGTVSHHFVCLYRHGHGAYFDEEEAFLLVGHLVGGLQKQFAGSIAGQHQAHGIAGNELVGFSLFAEGPELRFVRAVVFGDARRIVGLGVDGLVLKGGDEAETAGQVGDAPLLLLVLVVEGDQDGLRGAGLVADGFAGLSGGHDVVQFVLGELHLRLHRGSQAGQQAEEKDWDFFHWVMD